MILLDTNIVIYLFNGDKEIAGRLDLYSPREVAISFITLGELLFGALHSRKIDHNVQKVTEFSDAVQVIHSSRELCRRYGTLKHQSIKTGSFPGDHDLWIAATALQNNALLVTNNEKNFRKIPDLILENWTRPKRD